MTSGHTTSLQPSIRCLAVVQTSYDIAMTLCVHWVEGISLKKLLLVFKTEVRNNLRISKNLENTDEEVHFSEAAGLQPVTLLKINSRIDMKQRFS